MPKITKAEYHWLVGCASCVMLLTCIPYCIAWFLTPSGTHYMGYLFNPDEPNVYLNWMRQAAHGKIFLSNQYTTESQHPMFFNLFLLFGGWFSRITHLSLLNTYHLARLVGGFVLLGSIYWFAALFSSHPRVRKLTVLLCAFSSGLGWLLALITPEGLRAVDYNHRFLGLIMPESTIFLCLYLLPLFCLSISLLLISCGLMLQFSRRGRLRDAVGAGFCALVLGNIHSYDIFTVYLFFALVFISRLGRGTRGEGQGAGSHDEPSITTPPTRKRLFFGVVLAVLISLPSPVYQFLTFRLDPVFKAKAVTPTLTPSLVTLAVSYGLILLLALAGAILVLRRHQVYQKLLVLWIVLWIPLLYAPVSFQRKMLEGLHVPLCLLASIAVAEWLWPRLCHKVDSSLRRTDPRILCTAILLLVVLQSNFAFVWDSLHYAVTNNQERLGALQPPYYLEDGYLNAFHWLSQNTTEDKVVLCSPWIGNYVPAYSGNRVYIGHWAETLQFAGKWKQVVRFLRGIMPESERTRFLADNGITFVVSGFYENLVANGQSTAGLGKVCFKDGQVTIYRISPRSR